MPYEAVRSITLTTAGAVAIKRFVTQGASGIDETTAGASADGVSGEAATAAGAEINVYMIEGKAEVTAGAAVAVGATVASDATGRAVTSASGNAVMGKALTAATAADEVITVLLSKSADRQA